jgi:hypothetical protein
MIALSRNPRSVTLSERLLITRFITSVGLALLLIFGIAATAHAESDGPASAALMSGILDPHLDAVTTESAHEAQIGESAETGLLVGAALCVFGVLCGLTLIVAVARRWLRRSTPPILSIMPREAAPLLYRATERWRAGALTLTQLGLSRT